MAEMALGNLGARGKPVAVLARSSFPMEPEWPQGNQNWKGRLFSETPDLFLHSSTGEPSVPATGSQPIHTETNRTSTAALPEQLATGLGIDSALTLALQRPPPALPPDEWPWKWQMIFTNTHAEWGKFTTGPLTAPYPNRWTQIRDVLYRLRAHWSGTYLPGPVRLNLAIELYVTDMIPRPSRFTVYYSPGLNGDLYWIRPITRTNSGQVRPIAVPLGTLLASNGLSLVRLKADVIKVFPTRMADLYQNAPVLDALIQPEATKLESGAVKPGQPVRRDPEPRSAATGPGR